MNYGIHWFRRDLRVAGNPALRKNFKKHSGNVLGVFAFDSTFLSRPDFSHNRFAFFIETLKELKKELQDQGSDLLVLDGTPDSAFKLLLDELKKLNVPWPQTWTWNRDYEPFARARDSRIEAWLKKQQIECHNERDHLVIEPDEIEKFYQVYTPYSKKWFETFKTAAVQERIRDQHKSLDYLSNRLDGQKSGKIFKLTWTGLLGKNMPFKDQLVVYEQQNKPHVTVKIPKAGSLAAYEQLLEFKHKLKNYEEQRNLPAVQGTSKMSMFLKNGSITVSQIIAALKLNSIEKQDGQSKYFKELIWREFYYSILYKCPRVEHEPFLEKYKKLKWDNNEEWFEHWKNGTTGFPIVDAGMRELNQTGWMHNRVRMIVASFLTKDLLIDWRWGEKYFMEKLLDGDLAPNNGGWQWCASTGCDPQPYFRIFNPTLQSLKFDPNGEYIKTYLPELKHLTGKKLHEPQPNAIVDHSIQREITLRRYSSL